jgi:RimJ/RimL family protein N-acetyltransferase
MMEGRTVKLRSLELSDVDELFKGWNNLDLRNLVGAASLGPASRGEEEEWVKNTWKEKQERRSFIFAIEENSSKKLLGTVSLFNCDWVNRSAVLGIALYSSENWGKGYGSEALSLALDFAFKILNFNRVELETFDFNERAQRCFRKVGFKDVGKKRKARFIDGAYRDIIVMDILKEEWNQKFRNKFNSS